MASLHLYLLGPLDMRSGGTPLLKPPTSKSQSLLAYLALHRGQPQLRDQLVSLFWGERPEHNARRSLSTALWHVRRCLPDEHLLQTNTQTVQFARHGDLWLDVEEFEARVSRADMVSFQTTLSLYRGDLLEGFYDDWILGERYRLEALFLEVLARLMAGYEVAGDHKAALVTAQRLLGHDPLREDGHRLAMRAYCRLGQRNAALEQYERCREIVRAELAAEPMGETTALHEAILVGDVPVGSPPEIASREHPSVIHVGRSPLDVMPPVRLIGREPELRLLQDAWQGAQTGHGDLVLVSGEVGVGKTRLVEEFANRLRWQGARVLWGRCYEFERVLPYQPFAEALHTMLPTLPNDELAVFPAWALGEVARLVPELQERALLSAVEGTIARQGDERNKAPPLLVSGELGEDPEQMRLFEGVTHTLAALSSHAPVLLVLEDLHWAGESTIGLLHHLAHHLAKYPVLIVSTFRPEGIGIEHPLWALRRRLTREGFARPLRLPRLSAEAVEAMIVEMSGGINAAIPLAQQLYRETEGNPFFLMETVKALFERGIVRLEGGTWQGKFGQMSALPLPAGVSRAILARVRRLDKNAQDAVRLAAVLGREFDFELLNAAWSHEEEATLEALDSLLRQHLIEETVPASDGDFAFTHHKIQEVVYQSLPRPRCLHLHAQVGLAIENIYAGKLETRAGELAYHFERACLTNRSLCSKAVAYLLQAGQQAVRQSANQEAIAYYRRGLDILHALPETAQRVEREIELQLALAVP